MISDRTDPPLRQGRSTRQTRGHNGAPLTRQAHRAKTHLGYSVLQIGPDRWLWGSPHGLFRLVTTRGTRIIVAMEARVLEQMTIAVAEQYPVAS